MSVVRAYFRHEITFVVNVYAICAECKRPLDVASVQQKIPTILFSFFSFTFSSFRFTSLFGVWIECTRECNYRCWFKYSWTQTESTNGTTVRSHRILILFTRCEWTWGKVNDVHSTLRMEKSTLPLLRWRNLKCDRQTTSAWTFPHWLSAHFLVVYLLLLFCCRMPTQREMNVSKNGVETRIECE